MSKNKKSKNQVKPKEEVKVEETQKEETEVVEEKTTVQDVSKETQEENDKAKEKLARDLQKFREDIKEFVQGFEKYHNITNINPLKEPLAALQKNKNLEKEDKKYLAQVNTTIYAKTLRQGESRPEDYQGLVLGSLDEKVSRLSVIANGYGKVYITTINDLREDSFYCIKAIEQEGKRTIQDSLKITNVGGAYLAEGMGEQEIKEVVDKYKTLLQDEDERDNINMFTKEIDRDPIYAANYYSKITESRKLEAQDKNKKLDQVEEESVEVGD